MKNKPRKLPPRYALRFNERKNEYEVRKKYRYTDKDGVTHDTNTRWLPSVEACEEEYRQRIALLDSNTDVRIRNKTVAFLLMECEKDFRKKAERITSEKKGTDIDYANNLRSLKDNYTPKKIQIIKTKDLKAEHCSVWISWINSDTVGHDSLSGQSVRRYRNAIHNFLKWMRDSGYISIEQFLAFSSAITSTSIKKKKTGERKNREIFTFDNLLSLEEIYRKKNIGIFKNMYWYTLFFFQFFSGCRPGELCGLKWKNVHLGHVINSDDINNNLSNGIIYIQDSINEKETREDLIRRIDANNNETKNLQSTREIPIFDIYNDVLRIYFVAYLNYYDLLPDDAQELFVFPNLRSRINDKYNCQKQKTINRHIQDIGNELKVKGIDSQMMRHSTAHFLCFDMGLSMEDCFEYFGHEDSEMIRKVYADFSVIKKRKRAEKNLSILITNPKDEEESEENCIKAFITDKEKISDYHYDLDLEFYEKMLAHKHDENDKQFIFDKYDHSLVVTSLIELYKLCDVIGDVNFFRELNIISFDRVTNKIKNYKFENSRLIEIISLDQDQHE